MEIFMKDNHLSLKEALALAREGDTLCLEDITYNEKISIEIPNLTLIGMPHTTISYGVSHGTILPFSMGGDGVKTYGTTGSATCTIKPTASGFQAIGITFENRYKREGRPNGQAVAFKSECSHIHLERCRFLSHQDTLYVDDGTENVITDSYIAGDVDFIFGSADCRFINCHIHAVGDERDIAYYTAPSTYERNKFGFVFEDCRFTADDNVKIALGRAWFPGGAKERVHPRIKISNCILPGHIELDLKKMHEENPTDYILTIEDCQFE